CPHQSVGLLQESPSGISKHAAFALVRPGAFSSTGIIHVRTATAAERPVGIIAPGVFRGRHGCSARRWLSWRLYQASTAATTTTTTTATTTTAVDASPRQRDQRIQ
ncbi:unnamed protein product, partial [Laminaria digitata]